MPNETNNNFFLILDLDPDAPWKQDLFERRLQEKQNQWSRESTGFTKKAQVAKKHLELLSEIRRVMNDPHQREEQAKAAKNVHSSQQSMREEEFTRRLQLIERKGFIEQSEVIGLVAEFQDVFNEQAILTRITVEIRIPAAEQQETPQRLEPIIVADINERLAFVEKKDLYDLLHLPATTAHEELYRAAEHLYNEMLQRQPKTTVVSALTVLAGHAQTLFKTQEMRILYDNSIHYEALNALFKELEAALKHATVKKVYPQQIEDFTEKASRAGWESDDALQQLQEHALHYGWQLQTSSQIELRLDPPVEEQLSRDEQVKHETEIRNLQFQNIGSGLRLTWLWPAGYNEARLFYSTERWPQPDSKNDQCIVVTRAEYEALGHYILRGTTLQNYYILVSLLVRQQGQQLITPGVRLYIPLAYKMDLTYELKNPRFGYKQRTLHIYTQTPGIVPTLLLITSRGGLPFRKAEGTVLHREPGPINVQREHIIQLPDTSFPAQTFGKLFLEDDNLYAVVVIHHPHERKLRLG
jgi:hypothetical protein